MVREKTTKKTNDISWKCEINLLNWSWCFIGLIKKFNQYMWINWTIGFFSIDVPFSSNGVYSNGPFYLNKVIGLHLNNKGMIWVQIRNSRVKYQTWFGPLANFYWLLSFFLKWKKISIIKISINFIFCFKWRKKRKRKRRKLILYQWNKYWLFSCLYCLNHSLWPNLDGSVLWLVLRNHSFLSNYWTESNAAFTKM